MLFQTEGSYSYVSIKQNETLLYSTILLCFSIPFQETLDEQRPNRKPI